ncbi:MAG TPA: hypothetical protein VMN78_09220 [Longimicrobiales bacterium]|nr:hypothetical protein [Longimicrobiales bacterium]
MTMALRLILLPTLLLFTSGTTAAQYRRQVEDLPPVFGVSVSVGGVLDYEETMTPIETPLPDEERRGVRSLDAQPAVTVAARYGRGLAIYGNVMLGFGADAELSGADPLTGAPLGGTEDGGLLRVGSVGLSFVPLPDLLGLRLELGPAWLDLGDGGSYLGLRIAGAAKFMEIGDRLGVVLAWDGYFAGGQHDRDAIEFQIRGGLISGVRLGVELEY